MSSEGGHPFVNISLFYVFTCGLFIAAVSSSDCVVFNDRVSSK